MRPSYLAQIKLTFCINFSGKTQVLMKIIFFRSKIQDFDYFHGLEVCVPKFMKFSSDENSSFTLILVNCKCVYEKKYVSLLITVSALGVTF